MAEEDCYSSHEPYWLRREYGRSTRKNNKQTKEKRHSMFNEVLSPTDLMFDKPVEPGWYLFEIDSFDTKVTKDKPEKKSDGSVNAVFTFKCIDGPEHLKGRTFDQYFNEKFMKFGKNLWAIIVPGFDRVKGGQLSKEAFEASVGKKLKCYVKMDGKYPKIEDYQPA